MLLFIVSVVQPSASATGCGVEACLRGVRRRHQDPGAGLDKVVSEL